MGDQDGSDLSAEEVKQRTLKLQEQMARHVSLAAFCRPPATTPEDVCNNGTASFLGLPGGKFIVTNWHVWSAFRDHRDTDAEFKLAVMGNGFRQPIDVSDAELVDEDEELDIAVLSYPAERIEELGKQYRNMEPWPPVRATEGEDIAVVGFPGMRKRPVGAALYHESILLSVVAEAVSSRQIRCRFLNPEPEIVQHSPFPITDFRWGGMSGSLTYRLDATTNKLLPCGLFHAAGDGLDGIFYATHLDFLSNDGTIDRSAL